MSDTISFGSAEPNKEIVTLNIPRRDFGEFIQGLLGEPRTIEKEYEIAFAIDPAWIQNLDSVIGQRCGQNVSKLIELQARVYLQSGVTKTINSRESLFTFSDVSNSPTVGIDITWVFLIQFPTKNVPERQSIKIRAFSNRYQSFPTGRIKVVGSHFIFADDTISALEIRIEHTELTWGEDIFNHLDKAILASAIKPSKIFELASRTDKILESGYTFAVYMSLIIIFLYSEGRQFYFGRLTEAQKAIEKFNSEGPALEIISKKIDYYITSASRLSDYLYLGVFKLALFILLFVSANMLTGKLRKVSTPRSWVLLNDAARNQRTEHTQRNELIAVLIGISFLVNVAATIFLSHIVPYFLGAVNWMLGL